MPKKTEHQEANQFRQSVLLRIYRKYSKDEAVAVLIAELKEAKFKLGELTSENAELKDKVQQLLATKVERQKLTPEQLLDAQVIKLNNRLQKQGDELGKARRELDNWRNKYVALVMQLNQSSLP